MKRFDPMAEHEQELRGCIHGLRLCTFRRFIGSKKKKTWGVYETESHYATANRYYQIY
jgi:hypothetical protein